MKLLEGKIALITGASQGIGRSIALAFAENGADILFTDIRADERSEAVTNELKAFGVRAEFFAADASSLEQTQELGKTIAEKYGRVDVLVNNAGITRDTLLMRMSADDWDRVIRLNLTSVFNYTKVFSAMMMRQRNGSIINMSSIVGVNGNAGQCNYSAAKGGLIAATKALAKEIGKKNITVNAVAPGFIQTDMVDGLDMESLKKQIPLNRFGTAQEVAELVGFLVSPVASYITGECISINGGLYT